MCKSYEDFNGGKFESSKEDLMQLVNVILYLAKKGYTSKCISEKLDLPENFVLNVLPHPDLLKEL